MFGINTLTIEAKVELRLIQCDPYHTWTFLNPSLTFKSDHYFYVFFCIQVPSILQYIYYPIQKALFDMGHLVLVFC